VCVCACVCACDCVYACACACVCVCVCVYLIVRVLVRLCVRACVFGFVRVSLYRVIVDEYVCRSLARSLFLRQYMHMRMYICMNIICIHVHAMNAFLF